MKNFTVLDATKMILGRCLHSPPRQQHNTCCVPPEFTTDFWLRKGAISALSLRVVITETETNLQHLFPATTTTHTLAQK